MARTRTLLLAVSCFLVLLLLGGGVGLRVGAATDGAYGGAVLFSEIFYLVLENYVDPLQTDGLLVGAYEGMLGGLDARGAYLTPGELESWKKARRDDVADPGINVVKQFGVLRVVYVEPGSPAERAGIGPGDQVREIEQVSVRDLSLDQALLLLRGEPGSSVRLGVMHPAENFEREESVVERATRRAPGWDLDVIDGVAVLGVRDPARIRTEELAEELADVESRGIERLMVDLRDVAESDLRMSARLLAPLLPTATLVLRDRDGEVAESLSVEDGEAAWSGAIAVLVNGYTAGAPEAVAMVLRTGRGATIYGQPTYGLGSEPGLFELESGGGLLMSTGVWQTADGHGWNADGIEPDETIEGAGESLEKNRAEQLRRAIEAFQQQPPAADQKAA